MLLKLALHKNVEEIPHAFVVDGIDVVVPLFEPRHEFGKAE